MVCRKYFKNMKRKDITKKKVIYEGLMNRTRSSNGQIIALPAGDKREQMGKKS